MTTQSIIVYTPIENALYNDGAMVPLIGGLGVGLILFFFFSALAERLTDNRKTFNVLLGCAAIVSLAVAALTFHWLFI